nr:PoNe immunity protein domain-containing protein [Bhargavaea massiliensis]
MVRDPLKDENYFKEFIENHDARIAKFEQASHARIQEKGPEDDGAHTIATYLNMLYFNKFIAMYSAGHPLDEIKEFLPKLIEIMERSYAPGVDHDYDYYIQSLWLLSIAVMLDQDGEDFERIKRIAGIYQAKDALTDFLLNPEGNGESENPRFFVARPYSKLSCVMNAPDQETALAHLTDYIKHEWYPAHEPAAWHDTHQFNDYIYRGYWSFESGAVVKVLGLDDSSLKDVPYYPYDMVHYKN